MNEPTVNLLLQEVEYKITETPLGVWRAHLSTSGELFREFKSHSSMFGLPLIHYTQGRRPETGRRIVARGIIAVGRVAVGVLAVGHASLGIVAIGQLALGVMFGLGQLSTGMACLGQAALSGLFGVGQFALGYVSIGQFGMGHYVLAQLGIGEHVIDIRGASPVAVQFFQSLLP